MLSVGLGFFPVVFAETALGFFILWMLVGASSIFVLLSLFCLIKFSQNQVIARVRISSPRGVLSFVPILAFVCFVL